ncbi:PREDICTED: odorant receptor 45b-like [Wasmannia auropunctata]|uniref:odorant receptor 45b-like n=1 Tax=Wasmannia auropunctata TaxID=64793 RepID=UPI0005ED4602|nr:PREDICTED: odorant receptor 45b-like [Wasmannia auropunctata]
MINGCYSSILFVTVLFVTFQVCFMCLQIITMVTDDSKVPIVKVIAFFFYVTYMLTNFFTYCYAAEKLIAESTNMAYGAYECKWYDLPSKNAKDLMFIVYRSTIPVRMTAGKFGTFSLEMFGTVIKASMGYLSAIITIRDKN